MSNDPHLEREASDPLAAQRFRRTFTRVMLVQLVTLGLLWLLQTYYTA